MAMEKNPKKKDKLVWTLDIDTMLEVYALAKEHGKKTGDNIQEEFFEIMKQKKEKFKLLGTTDKDIDLLCGNLREDGVKILNLKELDRQRKKKEDE